MTRVVAGAARGRLLRVPRGTATRPTSDRVREAVFGRLDAMGAVDGARVLDLYAGSGALGLEAASRGARRVVLVEASRSAAAVARANAESLGLPGVRVVVDRVERHLSRGRDVHGSEPVDLVLVDPPYALGQQELGGVLAQLAAGWLAPCALVVVERDARTPPPPWPAGLVGHDDRRYGETRVWTARAVEPPVRE